MNSDYCQCSSALSYKDGGIERCPFCDLPKPPLDFDAMVARLTGLVTLTDEIQQLAAEIAERHDEYAQDVKEWQPE